MKRLGHVFIDNYHYCYNDEKNKRDYYEKYEYSKEEEEKAQKLQARIIQYITIVYDIETVKKYKHYNSTRIHYRDGIGYISFVNADRDIVDVYFFGSDEDTAFINAIVSYEFDYNQIYELYHRTALNKIYSERFSNGKVSKNEYHGPFFFAELALKHLKKFYGNDIPEHIVKYYEEYLEKVYAEPYKYDSEADEIVKVLVR